MKIIGRELAVEKGYVTGSNGWGGGVWVTWSRDRPLGPVLIEDVYDTEITALRHAVTDVLSVAFVPYGQGRTYIHWADLEQLLPVVDKPEQ